MLYCGLDLHANESCLYVIDENNIGLCPGVIPLITSNATFALNSSVCRLRFPPIVSSFIFGLYTLPNISLTTCQRNGGNRCST